MAARFFVVGGVDTNWSTIGNWSLTSGGAGGQTVPSAADDVTLDGSSGSACVLNTSARVAKTLTINGYTGSLTFDQQLSVSGSITFTTTGFTFAGAVTNKLRMIAAGTWTTNGMTIAQNVEIGSTTTFTCTLADALTVPILTLTNTTSTIFSGNFLVTCTALTISGTQTVTLSGHVQVNGLTTSADANTCNGAAKELRTWGLTTTGTLLGSALVVFNGTGTWTGAAGSIGMTSITINTAGTLTISGTVITNGSGALTLTYTAGTVVTTGSTLSYGQTGDLLTMDTAGMTWNNIIWNNTSATLTVSSALDCASLTPINTVTLNAALTATTLTLPNANITFAGSTGFTVGTLTNTTITATRTYTFTAARTYTVTTAFTTVHAAAQTVRFIFTAASSTNLTLGPGATQDVGFCDPTNIDASLGQTIYSHHGVATTSPNWITAIRTNIQYQPAVYQLGI